VARAASKILLNAWKRPDIQSCPLANPKILPVNQNSARVFHGTPSVHDYPGQANHTIPWFDHS
jgi:hypothetical protein